MRSINYTKDHGPRSLGRLQLPVETIDMIFSQVDDLASAFSLAMTNTRLMIIGEKRLHQLMAVPSWEVIGSYVLEMMHKTMTFQMEF